MLPEKRMIDQILKLLDFQVEIPICDALYFRLVNICVVFIKVATKSTFHGSFVY